MKKRDNQVSDEMLIKYLLGEASANEQDQVEEWINGNAQTKNRFFELKLLWEHSGSLHPGSRTSGDDAWARFRDRLEQVTPVTANASRANKNNWLKVAAGLLLLAAGATLVLLMQHSQPGKAETVAAAPSPGPASETRTIADAAMPKAMTAGEENQTITDQAKSTPAKPGKDPRQQKTADARRELRHARGYAGLNEAREFVCNGTPCPIEICIVQSFKCRNARQEHVSACSILEPDQSGQFQYHAPAGRRNCCDMNVDEITFRRVNTGETIVLTSDSQPVTAQDVFNYLTGRKTGDILAGIFHTDCNNRTGEHGITLNTQFGDIRLQ